MNINKSRAFVIIFALLISVLFITVGCKKKSSGWVNTQSMPGNTFVQHSAQNGSNHAIVYLGSDEDSSGRSSNGHFGPKDVSFEFKDLK